MKFFGKDLSDLKPVEGLPPLPHCDQTILHAPGVCAYCDRCPYEQRLREHWRINFTGEHNPDKAPCPSTHFRDDATRDLWPGNTAATTSAG